MCVIEDKLPLLLHRIAVFQDIRFVSTPQFAPKKPASLELRFGSWCLFIKAEITQNVC